MATVEPVPSLHVHLSADAGSVVAVRDGIVVADGRLRRDRDRWQLLAGPPAGRDLDVEAVAAVLARLSELSSRAGGGEVRWLVTSPRPSHDSAADDAGLTTRRDLMQMRRPLPVEAGLRTGLQAVATRPFRPGTDEEAWLRVNNRSFASHPDQSHQTLRDVAELEGQVWFDPAGFLLLDADPAGPRRGELDGFCWTKVHPPESVAEELALGEIFVIGVDPAAAGKGLGPALTVAGLDHLAARGIGTGMLYVDEDNTGAVRMYERLGFETHHIDRIYSGGTPSLDADRRRSSRSVDTDADEPPDPERDGGRDYGDGELPKG